MANLKEVRTRIASVISTQQITKAMKLVSASKLRNAQNAITQMRPYAAKMEDVIGNVIASLEGDSDSIIKLAEEREVKKVLIVVLTSDKGLCGSFNAYLCKTANNLILEKYSEQASNGNVEILSLGKKGKDFFNRAGIKVNDTFVSDLSHPKFEKASGAAGYIIDTFSCGDYDKVEIVYSRFKNAVVQFPTATQLLPLLPNEKDEESSDFNADFILEPNKQDIIENLIPSYIKTQFFRFMLDTAASEHGARMTAMDAATENAGDLLKELKLQYNRARQAAITKEISEIAGGVAALEG